MKWVFAATSLILAGFLIAYFAFTLYTYFYPFAYGETIEKYAAEFDEEPGIIASIIRVESKFDAVAVSRRGAMGLMQLKSDTAAFVANMLGEKFVEQDLFDPSTNIRFGTCYFSYLRTKFGTIEESLAAYNAGEGNVKGWLANEVYSSDGQVLKDIPFSETKEYVKKVKVFFEHYKNKFE